MLYRLSSLAMGGQGRGLGPVRNLGSGRRPVATSISNLSLPRGSPGELTQPGHLKVNLHLFVVPGRLGCGGPVMGLPAWVNGDSRAPREAPTCRSLCSVGLGGVRGPHRRFPWAQPFKVSSGWVSYPCRCVWGC